MPPSAISPRPGTPEQFAALRRLLTATGYTEEAIRERLGIQRLSQAARMRTGGPPPDALDVLIRLFLLEEPLPREAAGPELAEIAGALGLVQERAGLLGPTAKLYPVQSVFVASDLDQSIKAGADHVFSAISPQTEDFLAMTGEAPCPACLELCAGAAAGALIAAQRYAVQAYAFDISERCTAFAEFNRRLNGLANLTVRRGDLYAPARGQTFDRILAHPPYVPSLRTAQVFRDGGDDGEGLTRRIVEGLPAYLHPGGRLYLTAMLAEYPAESIETRLRRWLHHAAPDFDLVVVHRRRYDAGNFLFDNADPADIPAWRQLLEQRRIVWYRYITAIVERHAEEAAAMTLTRTAGAEFGIAAAERALAAAKRMRSPEWRELRPVAAAPIEEVVSHKLRSSRWVEDGVTLRRSDAFQVEFFAGESPAALLERCNGTATIAELGHEEELREWILAGLLDIA
ncbi:MAG TPA: methyltransferase [Candidatus Limnocylindrales bacterium]|nr:methyltransferase [Candidatus Limnocylindrales bacterium]